MTTDTTPGAQNAGNACGNCFSWERIEQAWGLCVVDDTETRVDDYCTCHVFATPPQEPRP